MSLTEQPAAYADCFLLWQKAVDTPGGIRFPLPDFNSASTIQMRLNKARSIQRRISTQVNKPNDPAYNTSEFDGHMVQVRGPDEYGEWWIYIRPHGKMSLLELIEPIAETEPSVLDDVRTAERIEAELARPHQSNLRITHARAIPSATFDTEDTDLSSDLE